jgi:hypothetical protein
MSAKKEAKSAGRSAWLEKFKQSRLSRALFWPVIAVAAVLIIAAVYQFVIPHFQSSWLEKRAAPIADNAPDTDNNPAVEPETTNDASGQLAILNPAQPYATTSEGRYAINGTNSDNVTAVRVVFKNGNLTSDNYLSDFSAGSTSWEYIADTKYNNMAPGWNEYDISLYNGNNVIDSKYVVIDLVGYSEKKSEITVKWLDKLKKLPKNSDYGTKINIDGGKDNIEGDLYEAGTISSGEYEGQTLYSFAEATMGFALSHLIKKNDSYWNLSTLGLQIAGLDTLPEETTIPDLGYTLKKSTWAAGFADSFFMDKVVFKNDAVGSLRLACWQQDNTKSCDNQSCLMAELPDHTLISYDFDLPFLTEDKPIDIIFNDGSMNTTTYRFITPTCSAACRSYSVVTTKDLIASANLKVAGRVGKEIFYEPKETNSPYYKTLYNDKFTIAYQSPEGMSTTSKYTYKEFLKMHPVLFWRDPIGRWIRFVSSNFDTLAEMCKPVVYLYPPKDTDVSVKVAPNGGMTFSNPLYKDGWDVLARPNGKLSASDNKDYGYLFWEGIGLNLPWPNEGFVVKRSDLKGFFEDSLTKLSLNQTEIKDFSDYWLDRLQASGYWQISFINQDSFEKVAPLHVNPIPDTVIRVLMYAKPLAKPIDIPGQVLQGKPRIGFTVVEWGGAAFDKP